MGRGQADDATATVTRGSTTNSPRREHDREVAHAKAVYERAISPQKTALDAARAALDEQGLSPEAHAEAVRKLEEDFMWETSDALQLRDSVIYGAGERLRHALAEKRSGFTSV